MCDTLHTQFSFEAFIQFYSFFMYELFPGIDGALSLACYWVGGRYHASWLTVEFCLAGSYDVKLALKSL
jgi:hypothetical protein